MLSIPRVRHYLKSFQLDKLFTEELGWDRHAGELPVEVVRCADMHYLDRGISDQLLRGGESPGLPELAGDSLAPLGRGADDAQLREGEERGEGRRAARAEGFVEPPRVAAEGRGEPVRQVRLVDLAREDLLADRLH